MRRIIKVLKEKSGSSALSVIILALAIIMLASVAFEAARLLIIVNGVRDVLEKTVNLIATENYDELYNGLREGYSGAYEYTNSIWQQKIDSGNLKYLLESELGVAESKGVYIKYTRDKLEYKISNISLKIVNSTFAPVNKETAKFNVEAIALIEIPLSFGWEILPAIKLNLGVNSGYTPKF